MSAVRILLAEDNPDHQALLTLAIREHEPQAAIVVATTRNEFRQHLHAQDFDCVVLDFHLLDCHADELVRILREYRPDCPAVVVSSSAEQSVAIRAFRSGSVDFLPKDEAFEGDALYRLVTHAALVRRRQERLRRRTERRQRLLAELAETDPLTGLSNRRHLARLGRGGGRQVLDRRGYTSALLLDLDHFKRINDVHGHAGGDRVLKTVAATLRNAVGPRDVACRWGGEEFLILRPGATLAESVYLADGLRERLADLDIVHNGRRIHVSASVGVAACASREYSEDLIQQADEALYLAKNLGRNRVCTWPLVLFDRAVPGLNGATPEERLEQLLARFAPRLGPVQREHLTRHSRRVAALAVVFGEALCMDPTTLRHLYTAGLFHDLGKMLVPEQILARPAPLSPAERHLLARHADDGAEMSLRLGADRIVSAYIRGHHRRYHDSPCANTPLGIRILSVADAFVAMTSHRPYQPACSLSAALWALKRERGRHFDPHVVDTAVRYFARGARPASAAAGDAPAPRPSSEFRRHVIGVLSGRTAELSALTTTTG